MILISSKCIGTVYMAYAYVPLYNKYVVKLDI